MATAAGKRIMVEGGHRRVRRGEGGALEGVQQPPHRYAAPLAP